MNIREVLLQTDEKELMLLREDSLNESFQAWLRLKFDLDFEVYLSEFPPYLKNAYRLEYGKYINNNA